MLKTNDIEMNNDNNFFNKLSLKKKIIGKVNNVATANIGKVIGVD